MRPRARRLNRRRRHSRATPPSWFSVRQSKANKNTRSRTRDREHAIENTRSRTRDRELKSLSKMTTFFHSLLCFSFLLLLLFCFSLSLSQTVRSDRFFFVFFFSEKKDSLFPLSFGRLSKRERPTRRRKKEVSIDRSMIILFSSSAFLFFE